MAILEVAAILGVFSGLTHLGNYLINRKRFNNEDRVKYDKQNECIVKLEKETENIVKDIFEIKLDLRKNGEAYKKNTESIIKLETNVNGIRLDTSDLKRNFIDFKNLFIKINGGKNA